MTLSMLDQMWFSLACGHSVVIGRVNKGGTWTCEQCGEITDLRVEPHTGRLERELDAANQIDLQEKARGNTVRRADDPT
jgi:transcription elongation factor Elf1